IKEKLSNRNDPFFGSHRLWLAQYSQNPEVQKSWSTYWLWQYADKKSGLQPNQVPGLPGDSKGNLDCDSYAGTQAQLKSEWASEPRPGRRRRRAGIAPHLREEVFKPFLRLDDARNQDEGGTGLGLAIARDIARSHGGDIVLSDSPLGGLRATVRVPV